MDGWVKVKMVHTIVAFYNKLFLNKGIGYVDEAGVS